MSKSFRLLFHGNKEPKAAFLFLSRGVNRKRRQLQVGQSLVDFGRFGITIGLACLLATASVTVLTDISASSLMIGAIVGLGLTGLGYSSHYFGTNVREAVLPFFRAYYPIAVTYERRQQFSPLLYNRRLIECHVLLGAKDHKDPDLPIIKIPDHNPIDTAAVGSSWPTDEELE